MLDHALDSSSTAKSIADRYGPLVFGLIVLLAVWQAIARPAMQEHREMLKEVAGVVHDARRATELLITETERQRLDARSDRR